MGYEEVSERASSKAVHFSNRDFLFFTLFAEFFLFVLTHNLF